MDIWKKTMNLAKDKKYSQSQMRSRDGKNYYITIILCCAMAAISLGLCYNAYGIFFSPVSAALNVSRGNITIHQALASIASGLGSPFIIKLTKKYPLKYIVCVGVCLTSLSFFLMGFATHLWMFNLLGILRGLGCACFYLTIITTLLGNWFIKHIGIITGITLSCSGIAGAIFSPLLSFLILRFGYKFTYILCGVIIIIALLPGCFFFLSLKPEERGLLPYGAGSSQENKAATLPQPNKKIKYISVFFVTACLTCFFSTFSAGMTQHFPGFAEQLNYSAEYGAALVSLAMIGNISSKFIMGVLCDKIGVYYSFSLVILLSLIGAIIFILVPLDMHFLSFAAFLFGSINAMSAIGVPSLVRIIYGNECYSEAYSAVTAITCVGSAFATTIIGYMYDFFHTFNYSFIVIILFDISSLILIFLLKKKINNRDSSSMVECNQRSF